MNLRKKPVVIIVRDGWGSNPNPEWNHANAIHLASKPVDDQLMTTYPHVLIHTCGVDVGLPPGVMGNSEVGHQNIGAGRIVEQELMRITGRINDQTFFTNRTLLKAFEEARRHSGKIHLIGLCSDGRVHSDLEHLQALLTIPRRIGFPADRVRVHAITDGRDTAPNSGAGFLKQAESWCRTEGVPPIATVIGRFYAMDRDHRWERVEKAYRLLVDGRGAKFPTALDAVRHYYEHPTDNDRKGDEFIEPSVIVPAGGTPTSISDNDSVIFFNFRGDRPRELVQAFVLDAFPFEGPGKDGKVRTMGFARDRRLKLCFVTMSNYEEGLPVEVAFPKPPKMDDIFGAYLSRLGLRQFRCAETEKFPHVTFFFNDYRDEPFPNEDRTIVPSPRDVTTYDQKPEMSAHGVTDAVLNALNSQKYDAMVVNFANPDMVGHTGNLKAAIRAVEIVDECVGRIVHATGKLGGALVITADHGNCEQMIDPVTGGPHTAHTTFDVELVVVDDALRGKKLRTGGRLADVAPTALALIGLPIPDQMTGKSLIV